MHPWVAPFARVFFLFSPMLNLGFAQLVASGRVRYVCVSNHPSAFPGCPLMENEAIWCLRDYFGKAGDVKEMGSFQSLLGSVAAVDFGLNGAEYPPTGKGSRRNGGGSMPFPR